VKAGQSTDSKSVAITRYTSWSDLPEYLTPQEFQAYLGLKKTNSYEAIKSLPHLRMGRLIRIPKEVLREAVSK
jgi:excisionase family DNA binding protein